MEQPNKLEKLKNILELMQNDTITPAKLGQFITAIVKVVKDSKDSMEVVSQETKDTIENALTYLENEHNKLLDKVSSETNSLDSKLTKKLEKSISDMRDICYKLMLAKPKDGKDADEEIIVEKVLEKIVLPEYKETVLDDALQIKDKLETLEGEDRLDAKYIKNLPKGKGGNFTAISGVKELVAGTNITIDNTNLGYPVINSTASSSGIVESVVAGTGISVDDTDPANPIVTNSAPDQTVSLTAGTHIDSITGTYPNFTINAETQGGAVEGSAILSTGETGGTKFLREDGDGTSSWQSISFPSQVEDNITDGHTTIAPSGNAVFDALAGKQATLTFGIAQNNAVKVSAADVANGEFAKFTTTGLESRTTAEVLSDIGAQPAGTYLTSANIEDSVTDGHTTIAPSGNAVYDALTLKAPLTSPTFATSITGSYLTASQILGTDGSKNIVSLPVATYPSLTELSYVKGVTSSIQTQLGGKQASNSNLTSVAGLSYASDSFVKMTGANTFTLDTNTYYKSGDSPTFATITTTGGIELGHASDTTLARVSAGLVSIEGVNIMTVGSADTVTGVKTLGTTGAIKLGSAVTDKCEIRLNDSALNDETWSGTVLDAVAGETIAVGDVCYLKTADGQWYKNDGILDGTDTGFKLKLGICVLAANDNGATKMLLDGLIASAAFPTFTVGAPVYLDDTAGDLVVAQPSTTNFAIRIVGYAVSATVLHFSPDNTWIVHV